MRSLPLAFIVCCSLLQFSCSKQNFVDHSNKNNSLFQDFNFLDLPVTDLRIGAVYIEGMGAVGNGLPTEDLLVQQSYANATIANNKSAKAELDGAVASFLNFELNGNFKDSIDIVYNNIEVITIRDVAGMQIDTETNYLFQGLRLSSFEIISTKQNEAKIETKLKKELIGANISVQPINNTSIINVRGANLFLAYKIVSFEIEPQEVVYTLESAPRDRWFSLTDRYLVYINTQEVRECIDEYLGMDRITDLNHDYSLGLYGVSQHYPDKSVIFETDSGQMVMHVNYPGCSETQFKITVKNKFQLEKGKNPQQEIEVNYNNSESEITLSQYFNNDGLVVDDIYFYKLMFRDRFVKQRREIIWTQAVLPTLLLRTKYKYIIK